LVGLGFESRLRRAIVPIVLVQEFEVEPDDRSTTNYDAIRARLNVDAARPAGLIVHTAGFTGTGLFRILDVWESEEDWQRFREERLMPAVGAVMQTGSGGPPTAEYTYPLHDFVRG
jgi:hypothetical protein